MTSKLSFACCTAVAAALGASIALTERVSPDPAQHLAFTQLLDGMRALDQDVARHALEARFQFAANYDRLAQDDARERGLQAGFRHEAPSFLYLGERQQLEVNFSRYAALAHDRQRLLESFKSKNALLKNSVSAFPGLASDVSREVHDIELLRSVAELRSSTLSLALHSAPQLLASQREQLVRTEALAQLQSDVTSRNLPLMFAHARVIGEVKVEADAALAQLLALPLDRARQSVALGYQNAYARAQHQAKLLGHFVSALALGLLALLLYAGLRLRATTIELRRSHATLEHAVATRTTELRDEMTRRQRVEIELRQAQKLEAVGQLASGIAHEINTPIQYVGDSLYFLREAFGDVLRVLDGYHAALAESGTVDRYQFTLEARRLEEDVDLSGLKHEIPQAFERALDGARQVAHIVKAMKTFSHASPDRAPVDLNATIDNTLTVARNEYKFVADVVKELDELPEVTCNAAGIRQVLLNLITNAAHAIGDVVGGTGKRGEIKIRTERQGDSVVISIADTGSGIPDAARGRIFDPFFTTKPPGKGSGQGLTVSQSIVAQHGGKLWFETELDHGSTFFVQLPIQAGARRTAPTSIRAA